MPKNRLVRYGLAVAWFVGLAGLWFWCTDSSTTTRHGLLLSALVYLALFVPFFLGSGMSARQKGIRFFALTLSLAFSLMLIETFALLGVLDYRVVFGAYLEPWESPQNRPDHDLIHVYPPHSRFRGTLRGGDLVGWRGAEAASVVDYDVRNDQNGFRNDPDPVSADLIAIGDSFVEAPRVPQQQVLTHRIAQTLAINAVNLGRSDYGPDQELVVLKRFGVPLKPKVCVWVFFEGNDLENIWTYRELREDPSVTLTTHVSPIARSFTKNATDWLIRVAHPRTTDLSYSGVFGRGEQQERLWFGYLGQELTPRDEEALQIATGALREAFAVCQQKGIRLVVVFAPTKFRAYGPYCEFDATSEPAHWTLNDLPDRFRDCVLGISPDVSYLDLTPLLQQAAAEGQLLFDPDDSHWSPAGHEFVARQMSQFLRAQFPKALGSQ